MENINTNNEEIKDTVLEEQEESTYVSQFSDLEDTVTEETEQEVLDVASPAKKPGGLFKYINPCIFIAFCIVVVSLLVYGAYTVMNTTVTGAWMYKISYNDTSATADEAKTTQEEAYYVFDKVNEKGKGKFHEYSQGAEQSGNYSVSTKDGKNLITLEYNPMAKNELTYEVTGNRLFGTAKLKLIQAAYTDQSTGQEIPEQSIELECSSSPEYDKNTFDSYNTDEKLTGTWNTDDRKFFYYYTELPYSEKLEFSDNGVLKITYVQSDMYLDRTLYYSYTVDKGKLKIKRATSDTEEEVKYSIKNGKLKFTDKTQSSIFYDAIFGDVEYKK